MEAKRHKRSHAEVVAAREAYAKERHERELAKEAKKAEREKLLKEREERRKLREARKSMTPQELRNSRVEERVKKSKRNSVDPWFKDDIFYKLQPYGGKIKPGDLVKAYFAGCPIVGEVQEIEYADDEDNRRRFDMYTILVKDRGPYSGMRCPVGKEKIITKYN